MLGIIFIYWVGKKYYYLAIKNEKNKWIYSILGIVIYYLGTIIGVFIFSIILPKILNHSLSNEENLGLNYLSIPVGFLFTWLFYKFLVYKWENNFYYKNSEILDENLNQ
jgi:hypothetical protein